MTSRVLLVGLGWLDEPGGLERYLADLRTHLGGSTTTVVLSGAAVPSGVVAAAAPSAPMARRLLAVRRAAHRAAAHAEVVDLHHAFTGMAALGSRRVRRLPKVVHFQGPWADEAADHRRLRRGVERLVQRGAERFVVLSGPMGRTLIEGYGADPWRVEVLAPGVDVDHFRPGDRDAARARLGVDEQAWLVGAVRRLVPRTGIHVLLEAWGRAAPDLPPGATLLVAGDGAQRDELEAQLAELAPARPARLLGPIGEAGLLDLLRAADLAVLPSVALEGFGLAALEALACGTPVLATRCGGLPDAVAGLGLPLAAPGDPDELAEALLRLASGPLPSATRCRAHAEGFGWPAVAARHHELYLAARHRRPVPGRRVLVLDHSAAASGGEIALTRLLAASEGTVAHAVLFEDGPLVSLLGRAGATAEVRRLGRAGGVDRRDATRPWVIARHAIGVARHGLGLAWRIRRLRPDVVHANSLKAGLIGGVAARLAGRPMVWHLRDRLADDYLPARSARLVRWAARHLAAAVVVPSQAVLDTLGPTPAGQERMVVADPYPAGPPRGDRRPGPPRLLMVGRLTPWKGQDVFVEAVAQAFPEGDVEAAVAGAPWFGAEDEAFERSLRDRVAGLGLGSSVRLLGHRDDVEALMADADIVVHASRVPEPFGQVVVEAMAAGAAVVATGEGGPSELIDDGVHGVLVPPGDVGALAAALRRLAHDPAERDRLGRAAQARIAERTDPAHAARRVAEVHERAAARRPVRRSR